MLVFCLHIYVPCVLAMQAEIRGGRWNLKMELRKVVSHVWSWETNPGLREH